MHVTDLQDDMLCKIFAGSELTYNERLAILPLVCKRWNNVLKQPSVVWQRVKVSYPTDYAQLKVWMKSRAPSIKRLEVDIADHVGPHTHEAALLVGSLIQLAIDSTSLTELHIVGGNKLDLSCNRWLPNLCQLRRLYLEEKNPDNMHFFPSWFLNMSYLPQLASLVIKGDEFDLPYNGSDEYRILPKTLLALKKLQTLRLENLGICAFSEDEFTSDVMLAVSELSELRHLTLTGFEFVNVSALNGLSKLEQLALSWGPYESFDASPLKSLKQFSYEFYGCANQMKQMSVILPEGLTELRISTLGVWRRTSNGAEDMQREERENVILDFLESRVDFPQSLEQVDLYGLGLPVIPAPVLKLKNMTKLFMASNRLEALPEGDWQQSLEEADFSRNRLPLDSPSVTQLLQRVKTLDLTGNTEERVEQLARAEVISFQGRVQA